MTKENTLVALTMDAVNALTSKELKAEIKSYMNAGEAIGNARWRMARAIHNVVRGELYDEDFEKDTDFYNFINIKKANASQLVNAVELVEKHGLDINIISVGKAYALSTLTDIEYDEFELYLCENDIDITSMSDKAVVELIKEWKLSQLEEVECVDDEPTDATEQDYATEEIDKEGIMIQIIQTMKEHNITIEELTVMYNN